jgi:PEP-CTERM motif-containing protein
MIFLTKRTHYTFSNEVKIRILLLAIILGAAATVSHADPLTFSNVIALQNGGNTSINLAANPGVTLTGSQITFTIDVTGTLPPAGTDTLSVTFQDSQGGLVVQQFSIPLFGSVNPPFTLFVTIDVPTLSFSAIPATLTVDLLNSNPDFVIPNTQTSVNSATFTFNVVQPVPEPATLTMFAGGISAVLFRIRKSRKKQKSCTL